jgi:hypothetical protein
MKTLLRTLACGLVGLSILAVAGCGGTSDTAGKGQVSIVLSGSGATGASLVTPSTASHTDSSCPAPTAASVTFSSILARNLDGVLLDVTIDLPTTVDLLALGSGTETTLPAGFLPPGTYDQFVVVMKQLELTLASGTKVAITPPGGGWTSIVRVSEPFTMVEGQTTAVTLIFRKDLSFACGLGKWDFHPQFECKRKGGKGN